MLERKERPMSLWISWVLPVNFPLTDSRGALIGVEPGSNEYSAVSQPSPVFLYEGVRFLLLMPCR